MPLSFDPDDPLHIEFVVASALMRCQMFGIPTPGDSYLADPNRIKAVVSRVSLDPFR